MAKKPSQKKRSQPEPEKALLPRLPAWAVLAAAAAWGAAVLFSYARANQFFSLNPFEPPPVWLQHISGASHLLAYLPQLAVLVIFTSFSLLFGSVLLRAAGGAGNADIGDADWLVFSLGLGFGAISLLTLGLGFLGLLNRPAMAAVLAAGFAAGAYRFKADTAPRLRGLAAWFGALRFSGFDRVLIFLLFLFGAVSLVWALAPEVFFDSLVYHLAVPSSYIQEGRVFAEPYNLNSGFPLLMQMLYAAGLLFSDDVLAKLLHLSTGVFLLGTLFVMGRRWFSVTAGLLAGVIFCSMPMAAMNATSTGVEIGSAWFTALAAYALLLFSSREGAPPAGADRTLLLAGIFAGLACGTKYPALFTVIAGSAVILYRGRQAGPAAPLSASLKQAFLFSAAAGLVFLPWPLKNLAFHGNPLYPFFGKVLGGQQVDALKWAIFNSDCFSRDLGAAFRTFDGFLHFALHPWFLTMSGMGNADYLGPFILLALPLPLLFRFRHTALKHLAVFLSVMWALWLLSTTMPRYFLPSLSLLSLLLAAVISEAGLPALRWALQGALVVVALYSAQWINRIMDIQQGWRVVFGQQGRADYLSFSHSSYPMPYYPAMEYINSSLPPDSRVLFAGDSRSFFCRRRSVSVSVHDIHPLVAFAKDSATPEEMQSRIAAAGITHLFLNFGEALRLDKSYRLFRWDPRSAEVFRGWWERYVEQLWGDARNDQRDFRMLFVYRIDPAGRPASSPPPFDYLYDLYRKDWAGETPAPGGGTK